MCVRTKRCKWSTIIKLIAFGILQNFVWLWLLISLVFSILHFSLKPLLLAISGIYFTWIYIRIIRYNPTLRVYGDTSEDFSIPSFFPIQF